MKNFSTTQLYDLKKFGERVIKSGVCFALCRTDGDLIMLNEPANCCADRQRLADTAKKLLSQDKDNTNSADVQLFHFNHDTAILAVPLKTDKEVVGAALIEVYQKQLCHSGENGHDCCNGIDNAGQIQLLHEMLLLLSEKFQAMEKTQSQIEIISTELSQTYEELVLLHKLSTHMKVTESCSNFLQMACDRLTDIVSVEGIAILIEKEIQEQRQLVIAAGSGLIEIDEQMKIVLFERLAEQVDNQREALIDSEVYSPFKYAWPENIKNILAVPLFGKSLGNTAVSADSSRIVGLMVAINRLDKPDFDSIDVKLFNSVAGGCAVFIENDRLFGDLKELFIGSLKALTSSIDAKDPYTRGHSERVAIISRWIAERIAQQQTDMNQEQIHRIYLSGLLHDIGKMGIDDAVLRKKGKLTDEEFGRIKTHPTVGAGILSQIKQMHDIIPGVLCHHERVDGRGYPNGVTGEQMPLVGKIVGLADAFDAMTSKRSYRDAMTVEQALEEIKKGIGTQFDSELAQIFINGDIQELWDTMQEGLSETYRQKNSEYGAVAVGALIK